jgi:hypothetical protein
MQIKAAGRIIVASVLFATGIYSAFAQQKPAPTKIVSTQPASTSDAVDQKWEYIVVSYGKTEFGAPQKTLAYRPVGLPNGQEAQDLQNNLDILGRFGWEAVAFVGAIGGDQQIVLKRKYDKNRIASEREAIARGIELYIQDLADILDRKQRVREAERLAEEEERNNPHLIDLDAEDAKAAKAARLVALQNFYNSVFNASELSQASTITFEYSNAWSDDVDVRIRTDLTKQFLKVDGKSYRRNEVDQYIKNGLEKPSFSSQLLVNYASVKITVIAFIQFADKPVEVDEYTDTYSSITNRWDN